MNERHELLHCPEAYDIVRMGRTSEGAAVIGANARQVLPHDWRHAPWETSVRDDGESTAKIEAFYCTRCTSIRWDDGRLHYKNIGATPPAAIPDALTQIRTD